MPHDTPFIIFIQCNIDVVSSDDVQSEIRIKLRTHRMFKVNQDGNNITMWFVRNSLGDKQYFAGELA
jgi:hypothetical protein